MNLRSFCIFTPYSRFEVLATPQRYGCEGVICFAPSFVPLTWSSVPIVAPTSHDFDVGLVVR